MDNPESRPQPSGLTAGGDSEGKQQRSGLTAEGDTVFATACASAAKKKADWWFKAEQQTADLITSIQPTRSSEERRKAIANFVEHLVKACLDFPVQVETFGSVPLKTYLPDGDIDLTALSVHTDLEETWAQAVVKALKRAEEEVDAEYRVKEVQYIQAEVKVIKCLVENIVVDISFNRTGGLNTFFFLEEVDRLIGKEHLFKRSIILVKAWCYYESRILGAHHGLISTFALETLVLYIINVYHSSLRGPLEVLYTFLVYFSNFDWDQYCVSLWGPLSLKDLEDEILSVTSPRKVPSPRKDGGRLSKREKRLLSEKFLEQCMKDYSEQGEKPFAVKHLNILDPIRCKSGNNLGRSVNVGSSKRIRSAFGFGARTLGDVLECSLEDIDEKFKLFFSSTFQSLERYRSSGRPDIADPKQERIRATMAGVSQPIAGNSNAFNPEGQWRQTGGKGRFYTNAEDIGRVQSKGSQPYIPVEHYERSMPVNRRSSEDHEHANHVPYRSSLPVEHQSRAPNQDSPRLGGNLGGQSGSSGSRNVSDPNLSLSNHDVGRPPGPSGDSKTNSSHGNFSRKVPLGEENDASTSGRTSAPSEQRKGQWPAQQRAPSGDPTHRNGLDSGSQSMSRPVAYPKYIPPHLQHGHPAQMHFPVSSAMPVTASSVGGPPSAPSVIHSSSSGESLPRWANSHPSMPEPVPSTSALPATKSLRISVASSREGATSHAGFSPHAEEQREHWRSPIENQKQSLHGASFIANTSAGRSFPTSPSENFLSPSSAPPQVSPQGGGPSPPSEIRERFSRVFVTEASSQLGGAGHSIEKTRSREIRPHSSDVKASVGMRAKVTNGSDKIQPSGDVSEPEFGRSGEGRAAELRRHGASQPSSEDTSVGGRQGAPYFPSAPHSYQEMPATVPYQFNRSVILEPFVVIPGQSLLVPTHHAGATGTELNSPFIERQVLPITVGVPGGPLHTPVVENGSVSTGPSFRSRPVDGASQLHVVAPVVYYMPAYSPSYYFMPTGTEGSNRGDPIGDLHPMDSGTIPGSQMHQESRSRTNLPVGKSVAERPEGTGAANSPRRKKDTLIEERSPEDDILFGDQKDAKKELLKLYQDERKAFSDSMPAARYLGYPAISPHPSYSSHGMQQQLRGLPIPGNEDSLRRSGPGTNFFTPEHRERNDFGRQGGNRYRSHGYQDRNNIEESYQSQGPRYRSGGQGQQSKHDPRGAQKNAGSELDGENSTSPQSMEKRSLSSQTGSMSNGFPGVAINAKPPVIMQPVVNDGSSSSSSSTGLLSPKLEFGSLGPFHPN